MTRQEFDKFVKMTLSENESDILLACEIMPQQHPIIFRCWYFSVVGRTDWNYLRHLSKFQAETIRKTQHLVGPMSTSSLRENLDKYLKLYGSKSKTEIG